ncbi:MAG: hypothetical protein ABR949_10710 [Candidatus Aquilonibacter sp.]|jgi:endo-beta-N-acetylglucosaminidase D
MSIDPQTLVDTYIGMWNEPDTEKRHAAVRSIWVEDGENLTSAFEIRGYDALYARADNAHQKWIAGENYRFRSVGEVKSHHGFVLFTWEMFSAADDTVMSTGTDVFIVGDDGRAKTALTFVQR